MAAQLIGAQLQTYNPNLPYTVTTTSGTQGLIVYGVSPEGAQAGITNTPIGPNSTDTGAAYTGITHFKNVAGKDGVYMGIGGSEIPLFDKNCVQTWNTGSSSAALTGWVVAPFDCTISGYYTNADTSAVATAGIVTVKVGSAGATLMTTTAVALSVGDTVAFSQGTAGQTIVPGGTAISINTAINGTAYVGQATIVMTRVGY